MILQKAKALGVVSLKLQGFEAAFDVQDAPMEQVEEEQEAPRRSEVRETHGGCNKCGSGLIEGKFGPYCHSCYVRRKEKNGFQRSR